ncbi:MSMEG_1061 family FMN-dependent PPOX-type flavoprotein [Pseudalkalibacillus decolorationis]|uniref:MSMEG_1061 family FMN-dependent PPOX-type flavoprotein n=1 Tax=Pseudalkalibacillus decolorationis TaxID=163879 RepID=UPI0021481F80|nr:MSMEG_1061 family FMN-dependent PPOX-type flavoprotein [Pseudalkalibacillus decolorationis]
MSTNYFFKDLVYTESEVKELVGSPSVRGEQKVITEVDDQCRHFIQNSPLIVIATSSSSGADCSPRGDAPGFVNVLDHKHLLIPERPGNRRTDSIKNLLENSTIGLLFTIPGMNETLRINGKGYVSRDQTLLSQSEVNGKIPVLGIGVEVQECFLHCGKAFIRSQLWNPEKWPVKEQLPSPSKMLTSHINMRTVTEKDITEVLRDTYTNELY